MSDITEFLFQFTTKNDPPTLPQPVQTSQYLNSPSFPINSLSTDSPDQSISSPLRSKLNKTKKDINTSWHYLELLQLTKHVQLRRQQHCKLKFSWPHQPNYSSLHSKSRGSGGYGESNTSSGGYGVSLRLSFPCSTANAYMKPREIPARAAIVYVLDHSHWGYHLLISAQSTVGGNKRGDDDSYGVCIEFL